MCDTEMCVYFFNFFVRRIINFWVETKKKRDLEAQLDETLASLRMEKALVCGELSEEESMLQLERNQLSDISTPDQHSRNDELIMELQKTIQDRSARIDSLKVSQFLFQSNSIDFDQNDVNTERTVYSTLCESMCNLVIVEVYSLVIFYLL